MLEQGTENPRVGSSILSLNLRVRKGPKKPSMTGKTVMPGFFVFRGNGLANAIDGRAGGVLGELVHGHCGEGRAKAHEEQAEAAVHPVAYPDDLKAHAFRGQAVSYQQEPEDVGEGNEQAVADEL